MWTYGSGTLALVARSVRQVVGQPEGTVHDSIFSTVLTNAAGNVAFTGDYSVNGSPQPVVLWLGSAAGLTYHLTPSVTPAPGMPDGAMFSFVQLDNFNAAGHLTFMGRAAGGGVTAANDQGIWAGPPDNLQLVAREGSPVTLGGGSLFSFPPRSSMSRGSSSSTGL